MKPLQFRTLAAAKHWLAGHGTGRALHLIILHDAACPHGRDHVCTCEPEVLVEDLSPQSASRGARVHRRWLDRHRSN